MQRFGANLGARTIVLLALCSPPKASGAAGPTPAFVVNSAS